MKDKFTIAISNQMKDNTMKYSKIGLILAGTAAAALAMSGCATGAAPSAALGNSNTPEQIRYLISQPGTPADLAAIKADLAKFTKASGIKVKLDVLTTDTMRTVLQTQLRSGDGPDVFAYSPGPGFSGALAKAGLLKDLTAEYGKNGWKMYDFAKRQVTEGGKLIGIANQVDEVGLFYNKDMFKTLGLSEPKNLNDLRDAAKTIAKSGVIPFSVSDQEGWQGGHLLSMALSSRVGSTGIADLLKGTTPWSSPDVASALSVWDQFARSSALTPSPAAVTYDNANALFYSGKAAMNPTGTWMISTIDKNVKFKVGFIPFPSEKGAGIFSTGIGKGLFVSAKTTKFPAVVKFLDYMQTPEHGRWQAETLSLIPAYEIDTAGLKTSPLFSQVIKDTGAIVADGGDFGANIDVLSTDVFNKAMGDGIQGILTGQLSPEKVANDMAAAYTKSGK